MTYQFPSALKLVAVYLFFTGAWFVWYLADFLDYFKEVKPYDEGCVHISGVPGAEDQSKWNDGVILMSSAKRFNVERELTDEHIEEGAIFVYSGLKAQQNMSEVKNLPLKKLPIKGWPEGISFQPHGIYVDREFSMLYAISHALFAGGERIEVFDIRCDENDVPNVLNYKYSITSENLNREAYGILNSITVIEPNKFYVTKFKPTPLPPYGKPAKGWTALIDALVRPSTYVLYCTYEPSDNKLECFKAADGFMVANGITHNKDKSLIFVGDLFAKSVSVFKRDVNNNTLTQVSLIDTKAGIDNLKYDDTTGNIYAASLQSMRHNMNTIALYPNRSNESYYGITEIESFEDMQGKTRYSSRELIITNKMNGGSNGLRMHDKVFLSSFLHEGFLVCPIPKGRRHQRKQPRSTEL